MRFRALGANRGFRTSLPERLEGDSRQFAVAAIAARGCLAFQEHEKT